MRHLNAQKKDCPGPMCQVRVGGLVAQLCAGCGRGSISDVLARALRTVSVLGEEAFTRRAP